MGGLKITAVCFTMIGLFLSSSINAETPAPIVQLQQPIAFSSLNCECGACVKGEPCEQSATKIQQASYSADPNCGAAAGPTCGAADPSCGAAAPTCGAASCESPGACGARESCGTKCGGVGKCGGGCGSDCIDWTCLNLCCKEGFWLRAESLMWWTSEDSIPTLATTSPFGTPIDDVGVLGLPTTNPAFSDPLFGDARWGGRIRFGWWASKCKHGLDGSIWGLLNEDDEQVWESNGNPAIARPFFNVDPLVNAPDSQLIAQDGVLSGRLRINTSSEIFGGDIGLRKNLCCFADVCGSTSTRIDCYAGYRYFKVREGIRINENLESTSLAGPAVLGTRIDLFDDFQTRNEFHGGTFGFVVAQQYRRLTAEMTARLSVGNIARQVAIDGATTVTVPGLAPVTSQGGLLAQPSNIGVYEDDDFAVLPEINFNLMYNIKCNTRLIVGYSFMYLGDLVRPGDIIDPTLNGLMLDPTVPITGPERPQFAMNDSRMWVMGLNFGVEFNF